MNTKWNKVTWYSQLLAVFLFGLIFYVGFNLGEKKGELIKDIKIPAQQADSGVSITITTQNIKEKNFSGTMPIISGSSLVASSARDYIEKKITEFRERANTDVPARTKNFNEGSVLEPEPIPIMEYNIDISAQYVKGGKTESVVVEVMSCESNPACSNFVYKVFTASLSSGKILTISDIIKKDQQNVFTEFVKKQLNNFYPEGFSKEKPFTFPDMIEKLDFNSFGNFTLDDKNLTIYFDKYTITAPAFPGRIPFLLQLEKIKNFLDPTFL